MFLPVSVGSANRTRLAIIACREVLIRKQSGFREVITWLEQETVKTQKGLDSRGLARVVSQNDQRWAG